MDIETAYKQSTRWLLPLFVAAFVLIGLWLVLRPAADSGQGSVITERNVRGE